MADTTDTTIHDKWNGTCPSGAVCSPPEKSNIGGTLTKGKRGTYRTGGDDLDHMEVYSPDQSGGPGTRYHYAHVDNEWQIIGESTDGGQTYQFDKYKKPDGTLRAGANYQKALNDPNSDVSKDTNAQLNREIEKANIKKNGGKPETAEQKAAREKAIKGDGNNTDADKDENADNDKQGGKDDNEKEGKPDKFYEGDEKLIKDSQGRKEYAKSLKYPEDLNAEMQDFLNIMMVEYKPRGYGGTGVIGSRPNMGAGGTCGGSIGTRKILCTITLPIPSGISDSNSTQWGVDELTPVDDMMMKFSGAALDGDIDKIKDQGGKVEKAAKSDEGQATVKDSLLQMVTGKSALQRAKGAVTNNNMELLFQGPALRDFTFTFPMYPRNEKEAKTVQQIIRTLKQGSSAKKSKEFRFITAPNTFFLSYYHKSKTHPFLNTFKECALTGINMQYTPDGNYSTYHDGSMTAYQMQLSFKEIEPVFDDDYNDLGNDMIGY